MVYKLAYRQTEGFLHSIASLLGLGIEIPDYSTLCRRSRLLRKKLRIPKAASTQPIHLMIDSTGLRIHVGNARKPPKQRAWRKLHIAVDRETGNIVASELTASRARDATRVPALLTQIQAPLVSVAADSAYDKEALLRKSLATTNAIENLNGTIRRVSRNVKRWKSPSMIRRWTALGVVTAEKKFHRIKGYRHMGALVHALRSKQKSLDSDEVAA